MHWYGGTMAEAVNLSKQRNTIFVVFVEGDNDLSKELATTIDNTIILKRLSDPNNFLAVKLKSGSENYTYFAQIYQFVPVPSLFFIGRNGTPLEVVCAGVEPQSLATRIDRILQEHRKLVFGKEDKNPPPQPSTSAQNVRDETVNFIQSEVQSTSVQKAEVREEKEIPAQAKESPPPEPKVTATKNAHDDEPESSAPAAKIAKTDDKSNVEYEVVCDGDVCVRRPKEQAGPSTEGDKPQASVLETESESHIEDKMERAKELIEARRKEKADKEKEEERQKEMERRAVGQGVAELKKWQADQELKQLQEERKREKLENNLARQRILEQIAQDRAERKAREQPTAAPSPQTPSGTAPVPPPVGDACARARVQFKLPHGGAHTAHFDADAPLSALHNYLADNLQLPTSNFSLWIPFPRRELTERSASLRELQLAPSAALLVLPRREIEPATPSTLGGVIAFLTQLFTSLVLDPTYQVFSWLRNRLFSNPPPSPSPNPTSPANPANPTNPTNPANPANPTNPSALRRRGNIHRLSGDRSGEDDNNTWNGNSTQQM